MNEKKVLVTGAEGFIGSHLVEALVRDGYSVRAHVLYNSFSDIGWLSDLPSDVLPNVEIVLGDVRDAERVSDLVRGCEIVFHLAALIAIPYSFSAPRSYLETNVLGTLNVLNACRALSVGRLVHTSTSEVYGTAQFVPMPESHPKKPQSPYAASKAAADHLVESYVDSFDLDATILRPFNTFGPRQSQRAIIPTVISQVLSGSKAIHLGNVSATRDFTFVSDTVGGFIKAGQTKAARGMSINLGTGDEWSIEETVRYICEITGSDAEILTDTSRLRPGKSEVERLVSDNSLAKTILGWEPLLSGKAGFEQGLKRTIQWHEGASKLRSPGTPGGYVV